MRYFLVVGEASADLHASGLIGALRREDPQAEFAFMGGDLMAKASGVSPVVHYREVAFMGLIPVLRNLHTIGRVGRLVQQAIEAFEPDVVIPLDFAGFNFRYILPFVKEKLGLPIIYYIAPKLWAWKAYRIKKLRKYTDLLLCILPFEVDYFQSRGVSSVYVGNPCVDAILNYRISEKVAPQSKKQIALLSGSRKQELKANLPVMLSATDAFSPEYTRVIAGAPGLREADYRPYLQGREDVRLVFGETYRIVEESSVAVVTSGTATLETALLGTPQLVCYRMGGLSISRFVFERFFSIPFISLVNLILGRSAVVELIGAEVNASRIREELRKILPQGEDREQQEDALRELSQILGESYASEQAAQEVLRFLQRPQQRPE